jgi:tetratricopeptide (TPR) repeat protein
LAFVAFVDFLSPSISTSQTTEAHTELGLGILSYQAGEYEEAIQHFQRAVATDPNNINAKALPGDRIRGGVLRKAIDLRRDYYDAMAYMNLMYREERTFSAETRKRTPLI